MTKRQRTKQQRIAAEKAALRQRIEDIACGAIGWHKAPEFFENRDMVPFCELDAGQFSRLLRGMQAAFPIMSDTSHMGAHVQDPIRFDIWDRPWIEVIDELYERGLRP